MNSETKSSYHNYNPMLKIVFKIIVVRGTWKAIEIEPGIQCNLNHIGSKNAFRVKNLT